MSTFIDNISWGSGPVIDFDLYYSSSRNGADMSYNLPIYIYGIGEDSHFGYNIKADFYLDYVYKKTVVIKGDTPEQWDGWSFTSGNMTVSNKTTGTTHLKIKFYSDSGRSGTYEYDLPILPSASALGTIAAFNVGNSIKVPITKYNSSFTDNLVIKYGNATSGTAVKTVNNIVNGTTVSFTADELNTIYGLMSAAKSGAFYFILTTYSGGTSLGSSTQTATGTITNANPTLSATVVDINSTTTALTGDSAKLVKYKSTARVTITASGNKGASISSKVVNGISVPGNTLDIANISTTPLVVTVTDSRGNSTTVPLNPVVVSYVPLTVSASFSRPAPTTGEVAARFSGNYYNGSFGAVSNTLTLSWAYRLKGASDWTAGGTFAAGADYTLSGNTFTSGTVSLGTIFDYQSNYDFILYFTDKLVSSDTGAIPVSKGIPVADWGENDFAFHVPVDVSTGFLNKFLTSQNLLFIGTNLIASPADDTVENWAALCGGMSVCFISGTGHLTDQPSTYGEVLTVNRGAVSTEIYQLWFPKATGPVYYRGGNNSGWSGTWVQLISPLNYLTALPFFSTTPGYTVPSVYSSRVTGLSGGYKQYGKLVYVNLAFNMAGSYQEAEVLTGFPVPAGDMVLAATNNTKFWSAAFRIDNTGAGMIYFPSTGNTSDAVRVSGFYFV